MTEPRFAYADPPYLGQGTRYRHPKSGRWDDVATHRDLLAEMDSTYDGWAYSMTSSSLAEILAVAPECRVGAWVKPFCSWKPGVDPAYSWEPVLFRSVRDADRTRRDWLAESATTRRGLVGAKPPLFCKWVLELIGWTPGDHLEDLFPGSGVMGRVAAGRDPFPVQTEMFTVDD